MMEILKTEMGAALIAELKMDGTVPEARLRLWINVFLL